LNSEDRKFRPPGPIGAIRLQFRSRKHIGAAHTESRLQLPATRNSEGYPLSKEKLIAASPPMGHGANAKTVSSRSDAVRESHCVFITRAANQVDGTLARREIAVEDRQPRHRPVADPMRPTPVPFQRFFLCRGTFCGSAGRPCLRQYMAPLS
jgi:hypothetical protein